MGLGGWAAMVLICAGVPAAAQQGAGLPTENQAQPDRDHPALSRRPPPGPLEGQIKLDVVVTDEAGKAVAGLEQKNFTLMDNKKPRPILSFQAVDGTRGAGRREPPVEVVLLLDAANTPVKVVDDERNQIASFLRRNGGRLAQPTSLLIFDDRAVKGLPQPTRDGNQLADALDKAESTTHTFQLTTQTDPIRLTLSLNALQRVIEAESNKSGRTILIWIGDGWPLLENSGYHFTKREFAAQFDRLVTMSSELRAERIALYSIDPTDPGVIDERRTQHYRGFLKGVPSVNQVRPGDLALPVFAIHSGGRAVDAPGDLGDEIAGCVAEAQSYYTLTFDPAAAKHVDEYHELKLEVDQPQLKARTSAGYYIQPTFQFQLPALSAQH